ncbi:MAG: hypothetical protein JWO87_3150, partial [Phycisphaerales bacterium]|nr:hypothetical protein [Phycisphaerales bacterium]
ACDHVSVSGTEDDARWYTIDVSSGTPTLQDQGNVSAGNNNYVVFPSIDINSKGDIGLNYSQSGTGAGQFMSMYVTGRNAGDAAGTMQTPVLVKAGVTNNTDGREGDLTGMSVDSTPLAEPGAASPSAVEGASHAFIHASFAYSQGNFWAANEFAASDASWGTQIGQFALSGNGPWSVNVNWGDGSSNTTFTVATPGALGTQLHTFAEEGSKVVTVTVTNTSGVFDSKSFTANVSDPAVIPTGGFNLTPVEAANSGNQTVATFTDPGGVEPLADYSASINWGDGTTTTGAITVSAGVFTVKGNHMYAEESAADHAGSTPYVITVTIGHDATPPQTVTSSATVSDPAVVATGGAPFTAVEGQPSAVQTVATFTDPGGPEVAIDYAASISWGDGSTSVGTVVANGDGSFSVRGSHTYATGLGSPGEFGSTFCDGTPPHYSRPIIVTISHELAPTATAVSTAVIAVPPNSAFLTFDGNLIVVGTAGDDQINVTPVGNTGRVNVQINNTKFGPFALAPSGRIVVAALSGNDDVQVAGGVRLPTVLFGGPGDDRLKGGHGPNIEVGCDGNDLLIGGNANDLLIGGAGADRIIGTAGDDTLVAGITSEDYNTLLAYQSNYNLLIGNVTDDGSKDILTGSSGNNVFFGHFQGLGVLDIVNGRPGTQFNT